MRFLIGTAHFFAPNYRDAGMHRFAKSLAAKGHYVNFVTFGQSRLKQRMKPETKAYVDAANAAAASNINPTNIHAHVHREWYHPPSGSPYVEQLTRPLERRYGRHLDAWTRAAARCADVVILECGYALYFFDAIRKLNPDAHYVAFYNDRLDLVGFRPEVLALHERLMPRFDLVRTNAERLLDYLPAGVNGRYVEQGVDKERIRFDSRSPYPPGSRHNVVSVGNMLFDEDAVRAVAASAARTGGSLHVIGAAMVDPPANVVVHGELPFEGTLPYIVHADVGLAPYRPTEGADYLIQSSLKIQQYSYCGLPILLAREMGIGGVNFVEYAQGVPGDVDRAVDQAFALGKSRDYGRNVLGWDEVSDKLLMTIADSVKRYGRAR
ncbi:MAG: hypothetical protein JWO15_1724 [Sphingomonadales bacterium]|nr:hypothetical protein [Sphingomonadales bacterium]